MGRETGAADGGSGRGLGSLPVSLGNPSYLCLLALARPGRLGGGGGAVCARVTRCRAAVGKTWGWGVGVGRWCPWAWGSKRGWALQGIEGRGARVGLGWVELGVRSAGGGRGGGWGEAHDRGLGMWCAMVMEEGRGRQGCGKRTRTHALPTRRHTLWSRAARWLVPGTSPPLPPPPQCPRPTTLPTHAGLCSVEQSCVCLGARWVRAGLCGAPHRAREGQGKGGGNHDLPAIVVGVGPRPPSPPPPGPRCPATVPLTSTLPAVHRVRTAGRVDVCAEAAQSEGACVPCLATVSCRLPPPPLSPLLLPTMRGPRTYGCAPPIACNVSNYASVACTLAL